jgi:hypothetical protein
MRRAAKRDANEPNIINSLRAGGWTVTQLSGKGLPDLMCMKDGEVHFAEVKMPGGKMETAQVDLHEEWERAGVPVAVVTSPEDPFFGGSCGRTRTYRDFPWEKHTPAQKAARLARKP